MRSKYVEESNLSSDDDPPSVVLGVGVDALVPLAQLPGERHSSFNNPPLLLLFRLRLYISCSPEEEEESSSEEEPPLLEEEEVVP